MNRSEAEQKFKDFYGFSDDDLIENRQGVITSKQKRKFTLGAAGVLVATMIPAFFIFVAVNLFWFGGYEISTGGLVAFYTLSCALFLVGFIIALYLGYGVAFGNVKSAEGMPVFSKQVIRINNVDQTNSYVNFGEMKFLDQGMFESGIKYRIFYLDKGNHILSVEIL